MVSDVNKGKIDLFSEINFNYSVYDDNVTIATAVPKIRLRVN